MTGILVDCKNVAQFNVDGCVSIHVLNHVTMSIVLTARYTKSLMDAAKVWLGLVNLRNQLMISQEHACHGTVQDHKKLCQR